MGGWNFNNLLSYKTVKYVAIRDWKLGALQKSLMLLIVIRIFAMDICMNCKHLKGLPLFGTATSSARQPTKDHCNPLNMGCDSDYTSLMKLPYCKQFKGDAPWEADEDTETEKDSESKKREKPVKKREKPEKKRKLSDKDRRVEDCEFMDSVSMHRNRSHSWDSLHTHANHTNAPEEVMPAVGREQVEL
jgi:hypothetical protein